MENKLSELSKPVAYDYQYAGVETCEGFGSWRNELTWDCPPDWMVETGKVKNLKPRYSQEYVSALLAELEAKDKRIEELGRANQSQDDHINQQQDRIDSLEKTNVGLGRGLAASKTNAEYYKSAFEEQRDHADMLEKRLATPVRLGAGVLMVSAYSANSCDSEWHLCLARDSVVSAIRAAGFTVEGDGE
ncbi:hypothetical protein PWJ72_21355 [Serratia nevei]|nr:hypothetical protein [Serratia nevei]